MSKAKLPFAFVTAAMLALVATAASPGPAFASEGPRVTIHVQAPVRIDAPSATNLRQIETYGKKSAWSKAFTIPYAQLEKDINAALDDIVPKKITGKETCSDPCPDVTWSVKISPKFKFTKKSQPTVKAVGASSMSTFEVALSTKARVSFDIHAKAETWSDTIEVDVPVYVDLELTTSLRLRLWPKVQKIAFNTQLKLVDSNVDVELNGKAIAVGAKWGALIGATPIGIGAGGPIGMGILGAILGDEAADAAEKKIRELGDKKAAEIISKAEAELKKIATKYIDDQIGTINDLKKKTLGAKIGGVGKSLDELMSDFGATVELHTVSSGTKSLRASAVMRMSGKSAGKKMLVDVRLPKKRCVYLEGTGKFAGWKIPLKMKAHNGDMAAKVGQSCAAAMGGSKVIRKLYRGANPQVALGSKADAKPVWSSAAGTAKWTGTLQNGRSFYSCRLEVGSLPKAAILDLENNNILEARLADRPLDERVLFLAAGSGGVAFDADLHKKSTSKGAAFVAGGGGQCNGSSGAHMPMTPSRAKQFMDLIDPDKCPKCGLVAKPGDDSILIVKDPAAFGKTPQGKKINAQMKSIGQ